MKTISVISCKIADGKFWKFKNNLFLVPFPDRFLGQTTNVRVHSELNWRGGFWGMNCTKFAQKFNIKHGLTLLTVYSSESNSAFGFRKGFLYTSSCVTLARCNKE